MKDSQGLVVTVSDQQALDHLVYFQDQMAGVKNDIGAIFNAIEQHPDVFMLNVYAAAVKGYGQCERVMQEAHPLLQRVADQYDHVTQREQHWFDAVTAWVDMRLEEAVSRFEAITTEWPQDLMALKCCEFLYYLCGQQYTGERYLAHTARLAPTYGEHANFLACCAFASELAGHPNQALQLVDRVVKMAPAQAWAHHALGHAYYMLGDLQTGLPAFAAFSNTWDQTDVIFTGHNRWHLAVFRLLTGDVSAASGMLEKPIWVDALKAFPAQQVEAISLAWRIELEGGVVPITFWQDVAQYAAVDRDNAINPFLAAHFIYAFTRAGKSELVTSLLQRAQQQSERLNAHRQQVWQMGIQLLRAVHLFANGDKRQSAALFKGVETTWPMGGGSDAQIDLFARTHRAAQST